MSQPRVELGLGWKVKWQVNLFFSKTNCASGSPITLPNEVSSQESRSCFKFQVKKKACDLRVEWRIRVKVKVQVNLSFFPKPNVG